jgi:hypothetical protein
MVRIFWFTEASCVYMRFNFISHFSKKCRKTLRQTMQQNIEKKIITEYISMASNEEDKEFEEDYSGFGDFEMPEESDTEEVEEEFDDPEAMQNLINSKKKLDLMELDNGNEDDMNEADARKLITGCENKNKNKILEKESCWNQVILIYTRKLINNIIKKIQSDAEFEKFKHELKLDLNKPDSIENIFIHIDDESRQNKLTFNKSKLKYAIKLDRTFFNQYDEKKLNNNLILWYYLIKFIEKIYKKNPALGYKYYNKIYFFLKWEESYLKDKYDAQKNIIYNNLRYLIDSTLLNPSIFDFKLKEEVSNKESIITFLSTDCSDLIESDKNKGQTSFLLGGRKRRTRRKHFRRGTSSKCHKTLKRKGKKTLKRKGKKTLKRKGKKTLKRK